MRDLELTAAFDRFRREGDPAALAYVFDHAAPELLRVARHLSRSVEASEDLLQSTFVAAIEGRDGFDASRRVEAWLIGILIHQAGLAYRKASRNLEVERLPSAEVEEPIDRVIASELRDEVSRALRSLPSVYREVLEPKLERDQRSVEIARAVGRTPSVVRTQVLRGMELLRRALPQGLASILLLSLASRRSLASVRDRVVERGISNLGLPPSAAASVPASALVGGIVMLKKALLVAAVIVFAVGSAWYLGLTASPDAGSSGARDVAQALPDPAARNVVTDPEVERPAAITRAAAPIATDSGPPDSITRHLSGMRGRLVEADGTTVANTRLVVRQLDPGTAFLIGSAGQNLAESVGAEATGEPLLTVGDTVTDAEGRFSIHGIRPQGTLGLLVDPGGARAALKLLELDPPRGVTVNIGDVVLAPSCRLEGVVIDAAGMPVPGARVRAGLLQTAVTMFGLQHYRSGDGFYMALPDGPICGDVPGWIERMVVELIPSTTTDAYGRFLLPRVSEGALNVMVDAAGHAALETSVRCRPGASNDAGELRLEAGTTRDGRVVDTRGVGLGGVSVRIGVSSSMGIAAVMRAAGVTDHAGRFRVEHVPQGAAVFLAARRASHHPWKVTGPLSTQDDLLVELGPTVDLAVQCIDAEGEPVTDVEFAIAPVGSAHDPLSGLRPWSVVPAPFVGTTEGTYWLRDLAEGEHRVRATSSAHGLIEDTLLVPDQEAGQDLEPLTLVFAGPRSVLARVTDAATGTPVEWARATLHDLDSGDVLYHGTCDQDGRVTLGAFGANHADGEDAYALRVEHPGFGRIVTEVVPGGALVAIALQPGGEVRGRVLSGGGAPDAPMAVTLRLADGQPGVSLERDLPWTHRVDQSGRFAIDSLPAGRFVVTVDESRTDADGLSMFAMSVASPLATAEVEVSGGAVVEVNLDVSPSPSAGEKATDPAATVRGQVRVTGGDAPPITVMVFGGGRMLRAAADRSGNYQVSGIPPGPVRLSLGTPNSGPANGLPRLFLSREIELQRGEVRTMDFDLIAIDVKVLVVDRASGLPAGDATISMTGTGGKTAGFHDRGTTAADGVAILQTFAAGEYLLVADADGVGRATMTLEVTTAKRSEPVRIELDAGVACAGRFLFPDGVVIDPDEGVEILLSGDGFQRVLEADGSDVRFDVRGATPGTYTVLVYFGDSGREYTGSFELPATGKADLLIPVRVPK